MLQDKQVERMVQKVARLEQMYAGFLIKEVVQPRITTIQNGKEDIKFVYTPIVNFRDFHCMSTDHQFELRQTTKGNKIRIIIDGLSTMNSPFLYF